MAKIQWNRVTWYSKLIAFIIFIALPFLFFYFGYHIGQVADSGTIKTISSLGGVSSSTPSMLPEYYTNPSEWQTDANNTRGGFSIAYPIDFDAQDNYSVAPSTNWRANTINPGTRYFTLSVPKAFEPQTNFGDATLTVGSSANDRAIAECMNTDANALPKTPTSTVTINGISFTVFHSGDVGAGNYYQTTSYRTMHAGQCYAIEYTIHSTQIANYPSSYNLKPFNQAKIDTLMQGIIGTFKFM